MKSRKSIAFGFTSVFALALALAGFVATASGQSASLSGTVQSGPSEISPVAGARVTLYAAGRGYHSGGFKLGFTTTDSDGNFTVEYTPPAKPAVLYLLAHKGNAGFGINSAIGLMGVAGMSNALPASVTINELTSVAAAWALAQFIGSSGRAIGAPTSNTTGFLNAVKELQINLVDISTGAPASFWSNYGVTAASCTGASPPVNCDGLERLDTIANILAACVESSGPSSSACSTLLSTTGTTNTLQAAHVMAINPVANVATLFALQSGSPPFTPDLSTTPDGWEIALNFTPNGANFSYPLAVAIDAAGNVWVTNAIGNNHHVLGSVIELNSSGGLSRAFNNTNTRGANFDYPFSVAVDAAGNVWVTNFEGQSVTELTSSGGLAGDFNNTNTSGANFDFPGGVAIDATGNVWVTNEGTGVTELTSTGALAGNFNNTNTPAANFEGPEALAIDAAGNVWVPNLVGNSVTELNSSGSLASNFAPSGANFDFPDNVAIDAAGNVWVTNNNDIIVTDGSVTELTSSGGLAGNFNNSNISGANFLDPAGVALDAAGHVWITNEFSGVTELTSSGGLVGSFAPSGANFMIPHGVAIDAAGNVWMANGGFNQIPSASSSVIEFVGAARPVLTPLVACLKRKHPSAVCMP